MKFLFWRRKKPTTFCEFLDSCNCINKKEKQCRDCRYYSMIDSGYGYCKALPQPILVAWCKDTCSFFSSKKVTRKPFIVYPELEGVDEGTYRQD